MTYPYSDCCPNLPGAGVDFGPCSDDWCCTHETWHDDEDPDPPPEAPAETVVPAT